MLAILRRPGFLKTMGCVAVYTTCVFLVAPAAAQSIASTGSLSFGAFVPASGGTVVLSTGGSRSKTGSVMLVGQGAAVSAGTFTITGTPSAAFTITLPTSATLSAGANSMTVSDFVSSPSATGTLSVGGTQALSVGATLSVGNNQPPGSYSGNFGVTVNYQ